VRVSGGANRRAICYGTHHVIGFDRHYATHHVHYGFGVRHRSSYERRRYAAFHCVSHLLGFDSSSLSADDQHDRLLWLSR
jgi:hypothetical protein